MSLWGAVAGGANLVNHAAGWLEGGLTASFEKLVIDAEMLQMMAEYLRPIVTDDDALGLEAIDAVGPGGHFFGSPHTMTRYETAFYSPLRVGLAQLRDLGRRRLDRHRPASQPDLEATPGRVRAATARPCDRRATDRVRRPPHSRTGLKRWIAWAPRCAGASRIAHRPDHTAPDPLNVVFAALSNPTQRRSCVGRRRYIVSGESVETALAALSVTRTVRTLARRRSRGCGRFRRRRCRLRTPIRRPSATGWRRSDRCATS